MNLAHIAWYKRTEGHAGGVPLFGHYMARCLGAHEWSWSDCPRWPSCDEPEAARILGNWLLESSNLRGMDAAIVDGFWGRGLMTWDRPVISVAHGTWAGIGTALGSRQAMALANYQETEYRRLPTVAVSQATAQELRDLYRVEPATIIRNGVDTEEFRPDGHSRANRPVVIYASDGFPKGGDLVAALRTRRPELEFRVIGAGIGQEAAAIAAGDLYLSPSRTDGCAYAGLQALACGLPAVASRVGLFADMAEGDGLDGYQIGACLPKPDLQIESATVEAWSQALSDILDRRAETGAAARRWAEECGNLGRWESEWRLFLARVCGEP